MTRIEIECKCGRTGSIEISSSFTWVSCTLIFERAQDRMVLLVISVLRVAFVHFWKLFLFKLTKITRGWCTETSFHSQKISSSWNASNVWSERKVKNLLHFFFHFFRKSFVVLSAQGEQNKTQIFYEDLLSYYVLKTEPIYGLCLIQLWQGLFISSVLVATGEYDITKALLDIWKWQVPLLKFNSVIFFG